VAVAVEVFDEEEVVGAEVVVVEPLVVVDRIHILLNSLDRRKMANRIVRTRKDQQSVVSLLQRRVSFGIFQWLASYQGDNLERQGCNSLTCKMANSRSYILHDSSMLFLFSVGRNELNVHLFVSDSILEQWTNKQVQRTTHLSP